MTESRRWSWRRRRVGVQQELARVARLTPPTLCRRDFTQRFSGLSARYTSYKKERKHWTRKTRWCLNEKARQPAWKDQPPYCTGMCSSLVDLSTQTWLHLDGPTTPLCSLKHFAFQQSGNECASLCVRALWTIPFWESSFWENWLWSWRSFVRHTRVTTRQIPWLGFKFLRFIISLA